MNQEAAELFNENQAMLKAYEDLEQALIARYPHTTVEVSKTQVSFSAPQPYAWAWLPVTRVEGKAVEYVILSIGLPYEIESSRAVQTVKVEQDLFTNHILITTAADFDEELLAWLDEAHELVRATGRSAQRNMPLVAAKPGEVS